MVVGKIELLKKEGFSKTWIASTSVLEMLLMVTGAGLVSVFGALLEQPLVFAGYNWLLFLFTGLSLAFILSIKQVWLILQRLLVHLNVVTVTYEGPPPYSAASLILITIGYSLSWIIQGFAFTLLIKAFFPEYNQIYFFLIAYAFSWIIGFISIFAPSGIGVKESVLILLLNQVMLPTESIVIAITARIWISGMEIIIASTLTLKMMLLRK